jgi:hypothetical protein
MMELESCEKTLLDTMARLEERKVTCFFSCNYMIKCYVPKCHALALATISILILIFAAEMHLE